MTEWMWMKKEGIDEPAQVARESFRMCHQSNGWVEYIPPAPEPVEAPEDGQPPAAETNEPNQGSPTPRRRSATPKE